MTFLCVLLNSFHLEVNLSSQANLGKEYLQVSSYKLCLINPSASAEGKGKDYTGSRFLLPCVLKPPVAGTRRGAVEIMGGGMLIPMPLLPRMSRSDGKLSR